MWRSLLIAVCLLSAAAWLPADEIIMLDGQKLSGEIVAIDEAGQVTGKNLPAELQLDLLRRIDRSVPEQSAKSAVVLDLVGGGRILGDSVTVADEKFHVAWAFGEKLVLPIDVVRSVRLKPAVTDDTFEAALTKPSADNDRLFVEVDGKLTILTGLVESLTAENVVFQYEGAQQTLPLAKLFGIVVAQVDTGIKPPSGVTLELADGSRVAGVAKSLADGKLAVSIGPASAELPWAAVKSVAVRSSRLAFLSDLDPAEVEESRLVTLPQPWQRDKSVARKTLTLGERKFDRGIGTHAYSKLVFDLAGNYDAFNATIGIDAAAERHGDCIFVVVADGQEVARERMTGTTEPKELKLDISGVKQLTLIVEPGEDLDLADLANWADARVIKQK